MGKSERFTIYRSYKIGKGLVTIPEQLAQRRGILCRHFVTTVWMQYKTITVRCDLFFQNAVSSGFAVVCKLSPRGTGVEEGQMRVEPALYRFSHGTLLSAMMQGEGAHINCAPVAILGQAFSTPSPA